MSLIKQHILLCPGPVNVASNIFQSMFKHIGHREDEFSELLESINTKILDLFEIEKKDTYYPVLITGSGTAANESVLSSIVGKRHILIISNGEFGERLVKISKLHNRNTHHIAFQWGEVINVERVEKYLKSHAVDIIAMVHHETSTGMLNPVEKIGRLTKKYKTKFFVDCVSSAGAEVILPEKWNITFCSTGTGKAISSLPGLGIIVGKKSAFRALKNEKARTAYLNLYNLYHYSHTVKQTPNTPAVHLFYALDQALTNIFETGLVSWRLQIAARAQILRVGMAELGLQFLLPAEHMSASVTTVYVPTHISPDALRAKLKGRSIIIYSGKGPIAKTVFQVGNIGILQDSHLKLFIRSLAEAITPLEVSVKKQIIVEKKFVLSHLRLPRHTAHL